MKSKPKKASPRTSPPTPPEKQASAAEVVGPDPVRLRRLARAGFEGVDRCPLLDVELDAGPRANRWQTPVGFHDEAVSTLAIAILDSGASPEALEFMAAQLRARGGV
jgi:hypothetical protein